MGRSLVKRERKPVTGSVANELPAGAPSWPPAIRNAVTLLCIALTCSACDSGPAVRCAEDPGLVGGGLLVPGKPWTPSKWPRDEWRQLDFDALTKVTRFAAVAASFADESGKDPDVIEYANIVLSHAIEGDEAPSSIAEVVSVCEQAVGGLTARELLEDALDVCEDGNWDGDWGLHLLGCGDIGWRPNAGGPRLGSG